MAGARDPIISIAGNVSTSEASPAAAEELGRELAKAGFRIMVYSSGPSYLEAPVVRGYAGSQAARDRSIEVRYPLHGEKPDFPEQYTHAHLFDWRPDPRADWEMSFYQSLSDVDGVVLMGGGESTMIAGIIATGKHIAIVALAGLGGKTAKVWEALRPDRDLPTADDIASMARPGWSAGQAAESVASLKRQMARGAEEARLRRVEELRRETAITWHAVIALVLFLAAVGCVPFAKTSGLSIEHVIWLLFFSPLLAGVSGSTIRLVFDFRQGTAPLSRQSAITTAALGMIAGGIAGLLFLSAQLTTLPQDVALKQSAGLVPYGVAVGFIAGFTLDAVFRKLVSSDVVELGAVESKKR